VTVRLAYTFDVPQLWREDPRLRVIRRENLPRHESVGHIAKTKPSSIPLTALPDTKVSAVAEAEGISFLGCQFRTLDSLRNGTGSLFSYIDGTTPFTLLVAAVDLKLARRGVSCGVLPSGSWDLTAPTIHDVKSAAHAIRRYFNTVFGEPAVVHRQVLVFSAPSKPSLSLGSAILLNVSGVIGTDHACRRSHWLASLGHEYAHTWWDYSTAWQSLNTGATASEMIAIFLSHDALMYLGDEKRSQAFRERLWGYMTDAVRHSSRSLVRNPITSSGASAAAVLLEVAVQDRSLVMRALQMLWARARSRVLSVSDLSDVLNSEEYPLLGNAVVDALGNPRPTVVRARVRFDSRNSLWEVVLIRRGRSCASLALRLRATRFRQLTILTRTSLSLGVFSASRVGDLFDRIEPSHLISVRTMRWLAIQRRPVLIAAWSWASSVLSATMPRPGPIKRLIAAVVALLLYSENPLGWRELSRLGAKSWPWASRRLMRAAACRATYLGEDDLRTTLSDPSSAAPVTNA